MSFIHEEVVYLNRCYDFHGIPIQNIKSKLRHGCTYSIHEDVTAFRCRGSFLFMGTKSGLPVDFVPIGSRLKFLEQTAYATGNYKRGLNGEPITRAKAKYLCECGNTVEVQIQYAKTGHTKSCGCIAKKNPNRLKHGLYNHPLYKILRGIIDRCEKKDHHAFHLYGGDGVIICEEWRNNPESFIKWALDNGWRKGLQIDKDLKGGKIYSPDNCTIVTPMENSNNRRNNHVLTYNEQSKTIAEWARATGINEDCISMRIKNGWSVEKTLTEPLKGQKLYEYKGELKTLTAWSDYLNICKSSLITRLNRGWSIELTFKTPIHKR